MQPPGRLVRLQPAPSTQPSGSRKISLSAWQARQGY